MTERNPYLFCERTFERNVPFRYPFLRCPDWLQTAYDESPPILKDQLKTTWGRLIALTANCDPRNGVLDAAILYAWATENPHFSLDLTACLHTFVEYGGLIPIDGGWLIANWHRDYRPSDAIIEIMELGMFVE